MTVTVVQMRTLVTLLVIQTTGSVIRTTEDVNRLVNWSGSSLPGEALTSASDNDKIAARDTPGPPLSPDDFRDPIESAGLFEGDIDNVSMDDLRILRSGDYTKNAIREQWKKWPGGRIPYQISSSFSSRERSVIAGAMKQYHDKTCIKFVPRTSEAAHLYLMKGSGCSSTVGRTGSRQTVSLGTGCVYKGIVMHELMHAAGFWHEQSRADRDEHITINWSNIQSGMEFNFLKYDLRKIDHLGAKYDTCSVMHYGAYAFAKNRGRPTIVAKKSTGCKLGQRNGFSDTDIRKLNTLYQCRGLPQTGSNLISSSSGSVTTSVTAPSCTDNNKCPVACGQCRERCDNNHVHCGAWARRGECRENPEYMEIYCSKACSTCTKGQDRDCRDLKSDCPTWGQRGLCKTGSYVSYMKKNCKKTCKLC